MRRYFYLNLILTILIGWPYRALALEFSEIAYNSVGADDHHEWIELKNESGQSLDLTGYYFNDGANHILAVPPEKGSQGSLALLPASYLVIADDAQQFLLDHPGFTGSVIDSTMSLPNYSASRVEPVKLVLLDKAKKVVASIGYLPTKQGDQGYTLERDETGNWQDSNMIGGSPGQARPTVLPIYSTDIHISEIMSNPAGADTNNEWVELYNGSSNLVSLTGWLINLQTLAKDLTIQPGQYLIIQLKGSTLKNTNARVSLVWPSGQVADSVSLIGSSGQGESYALVNEQWQWTDRPTPGTLNQSHTLLSPSPNKPDLVESSTPISSPQSAAISTADSLNVPGPSPKSSPSAKLPTAHLDKRVTEIPTTPAVKKASTSTKKLSVDLTTPSLVLSTTDLPTAVATVAGLSVELSRTTQSNRLLIALTILIILLILVIGLYRGRILARIPQLKRWWERHLIT